MRKPNLFSARLAGFTTWLSFALLGALVVGCSVNFTPQVLPNVKLEKLPNVTAGNINTSMPLLGQSKQDADKHNKEHIINLTLSDDVVDGLKLTKATNCAQLVELSSGATVVDFSNTACPASNGLLSSANIRFTTSYRLLRGSDYELTYVGSSGASLEPIGIIRVDQETVTVSLLDLCHSSSAYQAYCLAEIRSKGFWDIIMY